MVLTHNIMILLPMVAFLQSRSVPFSSSSSTWKTGGPAGDAKAFLSQGVDQRIETCRPAVLLAVTSMHEIQFRVPFFPNGICDKAAIAQTQKIEVMLTFVHHFSE